MCSIQVECHKKNNYIIWKPKINENSIMVYNIIVVTSYINVVHKLLLLG